VQLGGLGLQQASWGEQRPLLESLGMGGRGRRELIPLWGKKPLGSPVEQSPETLDRDDVDTDASRKHLGSGSRCNGWYSFSHPGEVPSLSLGHTDLSSHWVVLPLVEFPSCQWDQTVVYL
jgi:hypothetical protein